MTALVDSRRRRGFVQTFHPLDFQKLSSATRFLEQRWLFRLPLVSDDGFSRLEEKGLRLHLDYSGSVSRRKTDIASVNVEFAYNDAWAAAYRAVAAGAALVAGLGVMAYLKRSSI